MFKNITIVLPSLNPDEKLLAVVEGLFAQGFQDIVVINDGSDAAHLTPFEAVQERCTVLKHEVNQGKGRAMKTAFAWCMQHRPDCAGVITVDGDNQHHPEDIAACAREMLAKKDAVVLGVRDFSQPDVPKKSRYGNNITKFVFRFLCGVRISDTQTGLRAIPACYLKDMLEIEGERYEYETNMLLEMKSRGIPLTEVQIRTIYIEENASSHFHPFRDSFKIYKVIFKFMASSGLSSLLDLGAFFVFVSVMRMIPGLASLESETIFIATILARVISSFFNYKTNQKLVFKSSAKGTMARYYLLCVVQMCISALLVSLLSRGISGGILTTVIKAVVDGVLFFISFRIQKEWVFATKKASER